MLKLYVNQFKTGKLKLFNLRMLIILLFGAQIASAQCDANGGIIDGGPFEFCIDGVSDFVSDITLTGNSGPNDQWVITDDQGNILGLPPTPEVVDFDGAGAGICIIYHISYEDGLLGLEVDNNLDDLDGCFSVSNDISVLRTAADGGILEGGPFDFCVDGESDFVSGIVLNGNSGPNDQWVITDEQGNILGLPPTPEVVDFDGAGAGVCIIYHISYADGLTGLAGGNNLSDLEGCYDLSNSISVTRTAADGGSLAGGPFEFCVDGESDFVSGIVLNGNSGPNDQWVITDEQGNILGLPPTPEVVDFDGAGAGVCLIYHVSYADGLTGLAGGNNLSNLEGCYGLSNSISVTRTAADGGSLAGGPFEFCVDGESDFVSGIVLNGNSGPNDQWVITDDQGNILGLPPSPEVVDFDGAGAGVCLIYHVSYADGLTGLAGGNNLSDLEGCYGLSNSITVTRTSADGGSLAGGPFEFCVDGESDFVSGIVLNGNSGPNDQWVITDEQGNILGLPPTPEVVDFDGAGAGVCLIYHVSYADGLTGLAGGNNLSNLEGCYGLSNSISVTRTETDGGTAEGGPFEFCIDGESDFVTGVSVWGNTGPNNQWVITDDQGNILGLPPTPDVVDFDGAGEGVCLIYHISYADGLNGLDAGSNLSDLEGCFDLSNSITVTREICEENDYCESYGLSTNYEWIRKVKFKQINNTSGNNGGYADFTNLSTDIERGQSRKIRLRPGFSGSKYVEYWRVWIDYNQDGEFDPYYELVAQGKGKNTVVRWITIPYSAELGETTMRVSMKYGYYANPCEVFNYGEVEDYTINITGNSGLVTGEENENALNIEDSESRTAEDFELNTFPNPVSEVLNVEVKGIDKDFTLQVFDVTGKIVWSSKLKGAQSIRIDIDAVGLGAGLHTVYIQSEGQSLFKKVLIVK